LLLLALAALCLAGSAPAVAHADGDPASDFLLAQNVFVPWDVKLPRAETNRLARLLRAARFHGYPVKVALIATPYDLGAVALLWRKPQPYAKFLGQELFYVFKGRLLIVMPNGYGIYHHGKPITAERRLLDTLPTPAATGDDVAAAAIVAVRRLAGAKGITLTLPPPAATSGGKRNYTPIVVGVVIGGAWLVLVALVLLRWRRRRAALERSA
jgi:hypothetical protein